jgi:L-cysteine:1D-myo-inositol 2-amino-2-deoxy-alpha-D-glucopyranoside ligase
MVGYEGHKMSKSRGNLVFVSRLRRAGVPSAAVRLALLAHHYRSDWEWTPADLERAEQRLLGWRAGVQAAGGPSSEALLAAVRDRIAEDLDTPGALALVDRWAADAAAGVGSAAEAPGQVRVLLDTLLGVDLS